MNHPAASCGYGLIKLSSEFDRYRVTVGTEEKRGEYDLIINIYKLLPLKVTQWILRRQDVDRRKEWIQLAELNDIFFKRYSENISILLKNEARHDISYGTNRKSITMFQGASCLSQRKADLTQKCKIHAKVRYTK